MLVPYMSVITKQILYSQNIVFMCEKACPGAFCKIIVTAFSSFMVIQTDCARLNSGALSSIILFSFDDFRMISDLLWLYSKGGGDTVFSVGRLISGEELKPSKDKKKV